METYQTFVLLLPVQIIYTSILVIADGTVLYLCPYLVDLHLQNLETDKYDMNTHL